MKRNNDEIDGWQMSRLRVIAEVKFDHVLILPRRHSKVRAK